jgi:hypothetical protein
LTWRIRVLRALKVVVSLPCFWMASLLSHFSATADYLSWVLMTGAADSMLQLGAVGLGKRLAQQALDRAEEHRDDWNYGNAVHKANLVLGWVALAEGDQPGACRCLLAAGSTPGSPQLDSFGPNMLLAQELLRRGETSIVLQYFELCSCFWTYDIGNCLPRWRQAIAEGKAPAFGPHLIY